MKSKLPALMLFMIYGTVAHAENKCRQHYEAIHIALAQEHLGQVSDKLLPNSPGRVDFINFLNTKEIPQNTIKLEEIFEHARGLLKMGDKLSTGERNLVQNLINQLNEPVKVKRQISKELVDKMANKPLPKDNFQMSTSSSALVGELSDLIKLRSDPKISQIGFEKISLRISDLLGQPLSKNALTAKGNAAALEKFLSKNRENLSPSEWEKAQKRIGKIDPIAPGVAAVDETASQIVRSADDGIQENPNPSPAVSGDTLNEPLDLAPDISAPPKPSPLKKFALWGASGIAGIWALKPSGNGPSEDKSNSHSTPAAVSEKPTSENDNESIVEDIPSRPAIAPPKEKAADTKAENSTDSATKDLPSPASTTLSAVQVPPEPRPEAAPIESTPKTTSPTSQEETKPSPSPISPYQSINPHEPVETRPISNDRPPPAQKKAQTGVSKVFNSVANFFKSILESFLSIFGGKKT